MDVVLIETLGLAGKWCLATDIVTLTPPAGSRILGIVSAGNQEQFVENVALSGTTLTVTLAAAATAENKFNVTVLDV